MNPRCRRASRTARGRAVRGRPPLPEAPGALWSGRRRALSGLPRHGVWARVLPYPLVALLDEAGDHGHVAVVDHREMLEYDDVLGRVVGPQEVRGAPYTLRTEAGADAEGGAGVKRRPDYGSVGVVQVLRVRQPHKGAHAREARGRERVCWFVAGQRHHLLSGSGAFTPFSPPP